VVGVIRNLAFPLVTAAVIGAAVGLQEPAPRIAPVDEMKPYTERIRGTAVAFDMVPIPGGEFLMGSPPDEPKRREDEGPQRRVRVDPFWIGAREVTWDEYEQWCYSLEKKRRPDDSVPSEHDVAADAVSRPTPPYTDMTFGMGHDGYPAICMTHLAARTYCEWLTAKTGHYYRLPTEAEWEFAARAGTTTAYSFGDDPNDLGDHAWFSRNSDDQYQEVGQKKPNAFGLHDIHGNVAEWVLDMHAPYVPAADGEVLENPLVETTEPYPHVVRGGSWEDPPPTLRSAARVASNKDWKMQDPQIPQSVWYHTDAPFVGFRVVRPLRDPRKADGRKQD
jgi:formylglycine-generating enzyme required for sulfatase activity